MKKTAKQVAAGLESKEAIGAVDAILASVGLGHGRRRTRVGAWKGGERVPTKPVSAGAGSKGKKGKVEVVRSPEMAKLKWLNHGFSTRSCGFSSVYRPWIKGGSDLNLGFTSHDDPLHVHKNRVVFAGAVMDKSVANVERGLDVSALVTLRQTHSGIVHVIGADHGPLQTKDGRAVLRGDGMMTDVPGLLLGIQTADCIPVLVVDKKTRAVAAFHAGWRGTLGRIVERGIGRMRLEYGSRVEDLVAVVGPGIGPCCYAVGEEMKFEFGSQFAYSDELFTEVYDSYPVKEKYPLLFLTARAPGHSNIGPQTHLNLWEANRRQLLDAGLKAKNVSVVGECTSCTRVKGGERKYFSHRGEDGFTGRMLGVVGRAE